MVILYVISETSLTELVSFSHISIKSLLFFCLYKQDNKINPLCNKQIEIS